MLNESRIHHISALVGEVKRHLNFYIQVLGLRLIKQTLNFDQPDTYHLYYTGQTYNPNFVLTTFPSETNEQGRIGGGQVSQIALLVPKDSLIDWEQHLQSYGVTSHKSHRYGQMTLEFTDPDGLSLALVEGEQTEGADIYGFAGVRIISRYPEKSRIFFEQIGLHPENLDSSDDWTFKLANGQIILLSKNAQTMGWLRAGTIHHIAWAQKDRADLLQTKSELKDRGLRTSDIRDRKYFYSLYSREPGHTLFEYATEGPGFLIDEDKSELGQKLQIPPQYADREEMIRKKMPTLKVPEILD